MPKNILIFSDGTGQAGGLAPDQTLSNIYKFYRAARVGPENRIDPDVQVAFYDPGLGTDIDASGRFRTRVARRIRGFASSATEQDPMTSLSAITTHRPAATCRMIPLGLRVVLAFPELKKAIPDVSSDLRPESLTSQRTSAPHFWSCSIQGWLGCPHTDRSGDAFVRRDRCSSS